MVLVIEKLYWSMWLFSILYLAADANSPFNKEHLPAVLLPLIFNPTVQEILSPLSASCVPQIYQNIHRWNNNLVLVLRTMHGIWE